eukprot:8135197-Karenia_brevis.AAC.1
MCKDWPSELKKKLVSYDGSQASVGSALTWKQVEPALPPRGLAGSIPATSVSVGFVRDCLENPDLLLKD